MDAFFQCRRKMFRHHGATFVIYERYQSPLPDRTEIVSFLRSPSCWLQPCCSSISSGMPGTRSQLCIPAYFSRRGFYLARDSFLVQYQIRLDEAQITDLLSSEYFLICLYSKAGKKGVLIEVSLMLKGINLGKCLRKQASYLLMLKEQP